MPEIDIEKCYQCGGQRNYQVDGELQVLCYSCSHPRKRRTTIRHTYSEKRFWETCVHVALQSETTSEAIRKADVALEAWRIRWLSGTVNNPSPDVQDEQKG